MARSTDGEGPSFRFVGGKGGAGKTTCAAALAIARASAGVSVLLASADPAHSLGDVLGRRLAPEPRRLHGRALDAVEIDADRALARWMAARRGGLADVVEDATYLGREDVDALLDLSFPGVDELFGLLELSRLAAEGSYDEVVVDMAPTGHGLRLLTTPALLRRAGRALSVMRAKHRYLTRALGGRDAPDAAAEVVEELSSQGEALEALLRDADRCRFTWVLLAETLSVEETADALAVLSGAGMRVDELIVNRVREPMDEPCPFCRARSDAERDLVEELRTRFAGVELRCAPERREPPRSVPALRKLARDVSPCPGKRRGRRRSPRTSPAGKSVSTAPESLLALAPPGRRVLLFAGKGGVGKTTAAAAAALAFAAEDARRRVLLLSVDPAHSLSDVLDCELGDRPRRVDGARGNLAARELDASARFEALKRRYRAEVERLFDGLHRRSGLDASYDREALREMIELAPPGLDELLAILTLVDVLARGEGEEGAELAVVDTAPTGHALRLLAMPQLALEWVRALLRIFLKYREIVGLGDAAEQLLALARDLRRLGELLRDPSRSSVVLVTRPEELPFEESLRLAAGLDRASMLVGAVLVNAWTEGTCSRCRARSRRERRIAGRYLPRVDEAAGERVQGRAILRAPAEYPPPRGVERLLRWARSWKEYEG